MSKNFGYYKNQINSLETNLNNTSTTLTNKINATIANELTPIKNRLNTVETETTPISRGGTGGTTSAAARKNLGITRETNGYSYNQLGAIYLGGSNTNNYIRITLPQSGASFWVMCMLEISLRLYASGPKFGKVYIHGYSYPQSDWTNFYAYTTGFLRSDISVYGSDKKYIYIKIPSVTYFTCSLDKINIGDAAINYDFSNVVIDTVSTLPSTYQTASLTSMVGLKETYSSGYNFYRIYNDNWIEQGGTFGANTGNWVSTSLTFLKPFKDNYYHLHLQGNWSNPESSSCEVTARTTSGATVTHANNQYSIYPSIWYACGFI